MHKKKLALENIEAVIFDMDGTMIDNNVFHKKAFQEFCRRHGYGLSDQEFRQQFSGKKNSQLMPQVFKKQLTDEEIKTYSEEKETIYRELYSPHFQPVDGLHELIQNLKDKKIKLAIATTASEKNRIFALEKLDFLDTFDVIVGDEHVTRGKPDPEVFLITAEKIGVSPQHCLVFEDSPAGIEAAKNAGMTTIGLTTTHSEKELKEADMTINNFLQLDI